MCGKNSNLAVFVFFYYFRDTRIKRDGGYCAPHRTFVPISELFSTIYLTLLFGSWFYITNNPFLWHEWQWLTM